MRSLIVAVSLLALAGCVAPSAPEPQPAPMPTKAPPPPAPVPPTSSDWRDWPLTPGDWRYATDAQGSTARFGQAGGAAELLLRCDRATRRVTLARREAAGAAPSLTIRTSSTAREIPVQPVGEGQVAATLAGTDPLLDAMGFSRGRFVIQQQGGSTLVIPAWPETLRVAEDCRG